VLSQVQGEVVKDEEKGKEVGADGVKEKPSDVVVKDGQQGGEENNGGKDGEKDEENLEDGEKDEKNPEDEEKDEENPEDEEKDEENPDKKR